VKERIGFIGLGNMGRPMAENLVKAGFSLTVHTRRKARAEPVLAQGAAWADNPAEVARKTDIVIAMLPDSPDVEQVALGERGLIEGCRAGTAFIDMSTILPAASRRIAAALAPKGVSMLDAPVSGGPQGAAAASLSIMVGGPRETFDRCLTVIQALGKKIVHMGDNGAGCMAKLCNQVACVLNLLGVSEMLVLGCKAGLDLQRLCEVVSAGAGASWMLTNQAPKMLKRDFAPGFAIDLQAKDTRLIAAAASELRACLPGAALVHALLTALQATGRGDSGTQALVQVLEDMSGCHVAG
jgi:3-hydroxyisobutyrate dehydrogenase